MRLASANRDGTIVGLYPPLTKNMPVLVARVDDTPAGDVPGIGGGSLGRTDLGRQVAIVWFIAIFALLFVACLYEFCKTQIEKCRERRAKKKGLTPHDGSSS